MSAACTRTVTLLASATEAAAGAAMVGARSVLATTMVALEEPDSALPAVKVTVYEPALLYVGVQVSVPVVSPGPGVKTALLPAGSLERFALSELSGCPPRSAGRTAS